MKIVSGYINMHYHFCDVELDDDEELNEWAIIDKEFAGWNGEMMDYNFDGEPEVEEREDA